MGSKSINFDECLAITTNNEFALNQVYNTAVGDRTTLVSLVNYLKKYSAPFDGEIAEIAVVHWPNCHDDIPHSLASIENLVSKNISRRDVLVNGNKGS